ncbi:MAG: helix-turn-helix domain-containing protein [Candidatus Odinarchaeota archaeon]
MLYNFLLEIQHENKFARFSQDHPRIEILLWCNSQYDILELRGENSDLERALIGLEEELGTIIKLFPENNHVQLVFKLCDCIDSPLTPIISRYDCLELPPVKYFAGRMVINLIVTARDANSIIEDARREHPDMKVKMLKLAPLKHYYSPYPHYLPLDELKNNLTEKQLQAITIAFKKGYYELPRKIILEKLAKEMNVQRRTFEEHLRKAERKAIRFLIPALTI